MEQDPDLAIIPWDKKYEIGHDLIDSQHRIFLMLLNKLMTTIQTDPTKTYLFRVVNELKKFAEFHFLSEENVMIECNYPGRFKHEKIHSQILAELTLVLERLAHGRVEAHQVVAFLKSWLFKHIAIDDAKIAKYIDNTMDDHTRISP